MISPPPGLSPMSTVFPVASGLSRRQPPLLLPGCDGQAPRALTGRDDSRHLKGSGGDSEVLVGASFGAPFKESEQLRSHERLPVSTSKPISPLVVLDGTVYRLLRPTGAGHGPADVQLGVALRDRLALVALVAPAGEGELDLHPAVLEVERRRHQAEPALVDLRLEARDLAAVEQQLALTVGVVAEHAGGVHVRRDVQPDEEHLAVADPAVG